LVDGLSGGNSGLYVGRKERAFELRGVQGDLPEDDREGPTKAKMAEKMAENNAWGNEIAKAGTEDPQNRRSEAGNVKAESSLETTGSLAPVYQEGEVQDWKGLSKSERDLDFVNETMRTDQIQNVIVRIEIFLYYVKSLSLLVPSGHTQARHLPAAGQVIHCPI
ncbi:MAG: hypothetical protein ACK559_02915, partial [bacterium]